MAERQGRTTPSASSSIVKDSNSRYTIGTQIADLAGTAPHRTADRSGGGDTACLWGGTQSKSESSLAASRRYSTTPSSSFMQRVPRLDVCFLCHASLALRACCVPSLPSLRYSTRARGIERTTVAMLNDGVSGMERLNARSRSSTVIAQRSQPTGSVDFLLEPLPSACARPPATSL